MSETKNTSPKIVMIGGGTGSFTLLSSLKHYASNLTSIVNMVDDGGSTGILRDELGVLPPGDIRQCLVALSGASKEIRDLFNFRFEEGSLAGHSFGNLFLTALEKTTGSFAKAVDSASKILNVAGKVIPVTLDSTTLHMRDGHRLVKGESRIGYEPLSGKNRPRLYLSPSASLNPEAKAAIKAADIIVIAPGNLYGSLVPILIVEGMDQALADSKARIIQVVNLVTMPGQTDGFTVLDFVEVLESYIKPRHIDYALFNNYLPPDEVLGRYAKSGEYPVVYDQLKQQQSQIICIGDDFLSRQAITIAPSDPMASHRSLIRHDADKVSRYIMRIFYS